MKKLLFISCMALSQFVLGQKSMDFAACLQLALQNNVEIKAAGVSEETAKFQYKASYGKLAPTLYTAGFERSRFTQAYDFQTNSYVDNTQREYRGTVGGTYNLFSGFSVWNTIKQQKNEYAIAKINQQLVVREMTVSLAEKFLTILYLQELINANEEQISASDKQVKLGQLKFDAGVIAESELFKLKTQKANEELDLVGNTNKLNDNWISLKQILGISIEDQLILVKPNLMLASETLTETNTFEISKRALEIHPLNSMSTLRENKAKAALAIARSNRYPSVNAAFFYRTSYDATNQLVSPDLQWDRNRNGYLRFNLEIPIFNQLTTYSKIKVAKGAVKLAQLNTQMTRNQTTKEVAKAIADTKTAYKKVESAALAFDFAKKSYEADALKFELGKININELNFTKKTFNNAQAELIQSNYELLYFNALIKFYLGEEFKL